MIIQPASLLATKVLAQCDTTIAYCCLVTNVTRATASPGRRSEADSVNIDYPG